MPQGSTTAAAVPQLDDVQAETETAEKEPGKELKVEEEEEYEAAVEIVTPQTAAQAALAEKLLWNREKSSSGNEVRHATLAPMRVRHFVGAIITSP